MTPFLPSLSGGRFLRTRRPLHYLRTLALTVVLASAVCRGGAVTVSVDSRKIDFSDVNPLAVFDIDADGTYEILASSPGGQIAVFNSTTLKPIWSRQVTQSALTAPVVGNFTGTGAYTIAVGSTSGKVFFFRAGDGELLGTGNARPCTLDPTVVPLQGRDGLVLADDGGNIRGIVLEDGQGKELFHVSNTLEGVSGFGTERSLGRINDPLTVADVTGDGVPEVIAGTVSGAVQIFSVNAPEKREVLRAAQGTGISTSISVADFLGTGRPQMAFATTKGEVIVLSAEAGPDGKITLKEVQKAKLGGTPTGHLIALNVDGDRYVDLAGSSELVAPVFDGAAQFGTRGERPFATTDKLVTGLSAIKLASGHPGLLFADARNHLQILNPATREQVAERIELEQIPRGFFPAGDLDGDGKAEIIFFDKPSQKLVRVALDTPLGTDSIPTMTYGVTFRRDGQWTPEEAQRLAQGRQAFIARFGQVLKQAQEMKSAGNLTQAAELAAEAAGMRPLDPEVRSLVRTIDWRQNWLRNSAIGLLLIGLVGAAGWTAQRQIRRRGQLARAERLFKAGQAEESVAEYKAVLAKDPNNRTAALALAAVFVEREEVPADAVDILKRARLIQPDHPAYTIALARAYAAAGEETDEALDCYLVAIATLPDGRGRIAYHAGNILRRRQDLDQAIKYYKMALREGFAEPEANDALADAFVDTRQFNEKTLPVLEASAPRRWKNERFLEGLCRAYLAARRSDSSGRSAAGQLLAMRSDSLAALRLAARCDLIAGKAKEAALFTEQALQQEPDDTETVELLAQCYIASRRTDEAAGAIYRRALRSSPDSADLKAALAWSLLTRQATDDDSFAQIHAACEANPEDADLVIGLARTAAAREDHAIATAALERAARLGRGGAEIWMPLATAYAALGEKADPAAAERAFREALRLNPEDVTMLRNLADLMARQERTDPETMGTLERLLQMSALTHPLGKHLVRTYLANGRYDDAIRLVRTLAQHDRDDPDLQKLYAQASLASNRIDDAVRQYEELYRRHPDDRESVVNLAMAYAQKQLTDARAAAVYERALSVQGSGLGPVRLMLARHHAGAGRYAEAIEEYRKAAALGASTEGKVCDDLRTLVAASPDRVDLRWFLSELLINAGKYSDAIPHLQSIFEIDPTQMASLLATYEKILAKEPNHAGANWQKGLILKAQGRFDEARRVLELARRANPSDGAVATDLADLYEAILQEADDVSTRFAQGCLYYEQQDYDRAIGCFQKTCQDFRYENESVKLLGKCFVAKGMLEFALQEFKKLNIDEEMKEILYDLAQLYEAKNDLVGAKQVYRQLFAADINYRNVKAKFEMLAGNTSDPVSLEKTSLMTQLSEKARRRYELIEELGRGAMGIVYKARDNELDELVALKILPDNLSHNPEALTRFKSEARSARRLAHPNIVRIHDIGEEMGRKYISMEYVDGGDLKRYLRERGGPLEPKEVARLMAPVASALDYAHSMQIVHRDIKPANIMLSVQGVVKVSDFGIAKMLEMTSETAAGAVIGTPLYMSPEQIQGLPVDNRADIYSLGIMMYELASGRPPFTEGDLAYQHVRMEPRPIEGLPPVLHDIIMKCLAKDKEERWKTAGEIYRAFDRSGLLDE